MNPTPDCDRFHDLLDRVTVGELPAAVLDGHPHKEACAACHGQAVLVGWLRPDRVTVPAGFAERTAARVLRDRRNRLWQRTAAGGLAMAAAVLIGVAAWPTAEPMQTVAVQPPAKPVPVRATLADAGSALVSLSKKAADESFAPALSLFDVPKPKPPADPPRPATEAIAGLPQAARGGLDPVADTARRAVRLFVRDIGGAADGKSKS